MRGVAPYSVVRGELAIGGRFRNWAEERGVGVERQRENKGEGIRGFWCLEERERGLNF